MGFHTCFNAFRCIQTCDKEESNYALDDVESESEECTDKEEKVSDSYGKEEDEKMGKTPDVSSVRKLLMMILASMKLH